MLNGVGLGANQTGRKRSRAGRPLHTCVVLCNTVLYTALHCATLHLRKVHCSYILVMHYTVLHMAGGPLHTCVVLCNTVFENEL